MLQCGERKGRGARGVVLGTSQSRVEGLGKSCFRRSDQSSLPLHCVDLGLGPCAKQRASMIQD
jgi:hypothetical protein